MDRRESGRSKLLKCAARLRIRPEEFRYVASKNEDRVRNEESGSSFNELQCRDGIPTEDGQAK